MWNLVNACRKGDPMSQDLVFHSLEVAGFRAFRQLKIPSLGRVNLVVGRNNTGKTTLLEALWLYAYGGAPNIIWRILEARNEGWRPGLGLRIGSQIGDEPLDPLTTLKGLFNGRRGVLDVSNQIMIGTANQPEGKLQVWVDRLTEHQRKVVEDPTILTDYAFHIRFGSAANDTIYPITRYYHRQNEVPPGDPAIACTFIPDDGVSQLPLSRWWDAIVLTPSRISVLNALRIIAPEVEDLNFVQRRNGSERFPIVKLANLDEPVPLRSLGQGMEHMLGIALALESARSGLLLVDEIESGLHYSVQPKMWKLIFETAERLNIQVFSTTHSLDCIRAFDRVARKHSEEGLLISLRARKDDPGDIVSVPYDAENLSIATQEQIEVR